MSSPDAVSYTHLDVYKRQVFVHPKHHGDGIGRRIMEALEQDPLAVEADRMELGLSLIHICLIAVDKRNLRTPGN